MDQFLATRHFGLEWLIEPKYSAKNGCFATAARRLMVIAKSFLGLLPLCGDFFQVDGVRIDIDRRIMDLPVDDPCRAVLWQELETVLARLADISSQLTQCPATNITELRAKAAVLTIMQQFGNTADGPIMQEEKMAFALSLADNTLSLPD